MKIKNATIDILIGRDSTTINLYDMDAGAQFCEVTLTPQQLSDALSRLSYVPCEIIVRGLDRVGKKEEYKPLEFPFDYSKSEWKNRAEDAAKVAITFADDGWIPDAYFGSQDSFYEKGGKKYARTTQRRWVEVGDLAESKRAMKGKGAT